MIVSPTSIQYIHTEYRAASIQHSFNFSLENLLCAEISNVTVIVVRFVKSYWMLNNEAYVKLRKWYSNKCCIPPVLYHMCFGALAWISHHIHVCKLKFLHLYAWVGLIFGHSSFKMDSSVSVYAHLSIVNRLNLTVHFIICINFLLTELFMQTARITLLALSFTWVQTARVVSESNWV